MPGLSGSRWASKSSKEPTPVPVAAQPSTISWQKEYLKELTTTATAAATKPVQAVPAPAAPKSEAVKPIVKLPPPPPAPAIETQSSPATPPKSSPAPALWSDMDDDDDDDSALAASMAKLAPTPATPGPIKEPTPAGPEPVAAPAKPRSGGLMGSKHAVKYSSPAAVTKASNGKRPAEQVYTLPPYAGLAKDEYYGLVQRCAGKTTTESEWAVLVEGVKDARPAGTWGADWREKGC
jgi:hypothetical protein